MSNAPPLHPRENMRLFGHQPAQKQFLQLYEQQKLAGTFLISGPKGIGKATLAYHVLRYVLSGGAGGGDALFGPEDLSIAQDHPIITRITAQSHPDVMVLEGVADEKSNSHSTDIKVDKARAIGEFLALTPAESKYRIVIIDSADDLNNNAANSLLKLIEEPPAQAIMLLVSHNPGRLLPTIRSRCRHIRLHAPEAKDFTHIMQALNSALDENTLRVLYVLSQGAPGLALTLAHHDAPTSYITILDLMRQAPNMPTTELIKCAEQLADKRNAKGWDIWGMIWQTVLTRIIGAINGTLREHIIEGEEELLLRIAAIKPLPEWLELWTQSQKLLGATSRLHLDKKHTVLSLFGAIEGVEIAA